MSLDLHKLNMDVTSAILKAEALDCVAEKAWLAVASAEQALVDAMTPLGPKYSVQVGIATHGVVTARQRAEARRRGA